MLQWGDPKQEPPAKDPMWDKLKGWFKPGFSDASWTKIPAPLRNKRGKASGWNSRHILLRKTFTLPAPGYAALRLRLTSGRGHATEVYLNGVLVARIVRGVRRGYAVIPLDGGAARLLRQGENVIAVHCRKDDAGARSLDVGLQGVRRR